MYHIIIMLSPLSSRLSPATWESWKIREGGKGGQVYVAPFSPPVGSPRTIPFKKVTDGTKEKETPHSRLL